MLSFLADNPQYKKWQRILTLLLGTGCRIGELTGLCWDNIDFDNKIITIDHTLTYHKDPDGKCRLHISTPKTDAGVRMIPMFDDVQAVLNEILEEQKKKSVMIEFEGKSGFVLTNRYNSLYLPNSINKAFARIIEDYNFRETLDAQNKNRKPELMPHFSAHNLRHTFCTRICENVTNISVIQEVMGHRDIHTTIAELNVFHFDLDQLAHSRSRGSKKADHKVPEQFAVLFQTLLEVQVIRFTDNIFEERLLLNLDKGQLPLLFAHAFKVAVHSTQAKIYRLRFEVIHEPHLVCREVILGNAAVLLGELSQGEQIGRL